MKRKIAIVTGGGSGLGFAIAEKFVQNGIETIIAGRNKEKLNAAAEKLGELCHAVSCDLADLGSIPGFVKGVIDQYGQIDILVNNAGINMKKEFTEVTDEEFQQVITTNITAVFSVSREVVKNMLQNGSGSIINISSAVSTSAIPEAAVYSGTKGAVDAITRSLAAELGPRGIRVNAIRPGMVVTEGTRSGGIVESDMRKQVEAQTPLRRIGQPHDITGAAVFLACDDSAWITGETLMISGGYR